MYKYPNVDKLLSRRAFFLGSCKGILLSTVLIRLLYLQIFQSDKYKLLADKNRISLRLISPSRGNILDRNNNILAFNKNSHSLFANSKYIYEVEKTIEKISRIIYLDDNEINNILQNYSKKKNKDLPYIIKRNLKWNEVSSLNVNLINLPNVSIEQGLKRMYPFNNLAAHTIGYLAPPSHSDVKKNPILGMMDVDVGRFGAEETYDQKLSGSPGTKHLEVNAFGREVREIRKEEGINGENVKLTIDIKLQKFLNTLLKNKSGSIVVIDVNTGELLGMESSPNFDPNLFTKTMSQEEWNKLIKNPLAPLVNKSISGEYSPGSTFKVVVLYSALVNKIIKVNSTIKCSSKIEFGDRNFYCWCHKKKTGCWAARNHQRKVGPKLALAQSCDVFFYELAKKIGINNISKTAYQFGIGSQTGIELSGEKSGLMPTKSWKKKIHKQNWQIGETMITGVGQGYLTSTPIQLAVMTAMISNNGKKVSPKIFFNDNSNRNLLNEENNGIDSKYFSLIQQGMFDVVNKPYGTAHNVKLTKPVFAGKTGTVQIRTITEEERETGIIPNKELPLEKRDHALFVGYAPYNNPKIAVSVVVENGGSGSRVAAPIARKVFKKILS